MFMYLNCVVKLHYLAVISIVGQCSGVSQPCDCILKHACIMQFENSCFSLDNLMVVSTSF